MKRKTLQIFVIVLIPVTLIFGFQTGKEKTNAVRGAQSIEDSIRGAESYRPKDGFIPDSTTATKIAEAVLIPIYGERQILAERPLRATLKDETWTVVGTLQSGLIGGTAIIKLSKVDGRVLFVTHTQ